jgi:hypothetical protein
MPPYAPTAGIVVGADDLQVSGASIRDLEVTGFGTGIEVRSGYGTGISDVRVHDNGQHGISLSDRAINSRIEGRNGLSRVSWFTAGLPTTEPFATLATFQRVSCLIHDNKEEGLHIGVRCSTTKRRTSRSKGPSGQECSRHALGEPVPTR